MKAKVKFDSAQLKAFFLHHVEKIVFTGFIIAFLMICAAAFKLKPYEKTPAELKAVAEKISQEVEKNAPPEKFAGLASVPNFSNLGAVGPAPVDARFYAVRPLSLPYELRQASRKEPKFFALEDVLAFPGYGGIAISENGSAQRVPSFGDGGAMGMDSSQGMTPGSAMQSGMPPPEMMPSGPTSGGGPGAGGMMGPGSGDMMGPGSGGMMGPNSGGRARGGRRTAKKAPKKKQEPTPVARPPKPRSTEKIVITQPPSGSQVEGRYWVCLVGAIPYSKQLGDYQNTFRDARFYDVKRDYPRYSLPIIERAEVNRGGVGDWQQLDVEAALEDFSKWAVEYPDVIDPRFKSELTEPLPPLIFANHDKQKVNHPRTKVVEKAKAADEVGPKKKANPRTLSGTAARARGGNPSAMSGGDSGGMPPGYSGPESYGGMGGAGMPGAGIGASSRRAGPVVEHRLFRFFDFEVEPGKTYRYRIKLVLVNPNAGVPPRFLESYDFGKGATREADWSPVSPEVTVIAGNRLLAGTVTEGRGKGEPAGKILAKLFDSTEAAEIRRVFDVNRGSVLNEHQVEVGLPDPSGTKGNRSATVDFETNAVVLDLFGGEKLPGVRSSVGTTGPKVPGHILVLDNDGEIKVLLQSDDAGVFETEEEEFKNQVAPDKKDEAQKAEGGSSRGFDNFDELDAGKKKRGR
jgi:hypothetical protein